MRLGRQCRISFLQTANKTRGTSRRLRPHFFFWSLHVMGYKRLEHLYGSSSREERGERSRRVSSEQGDRSRRISADSAAYDEALEADTDVSQPSDHQPFIRQSVSDADPNVPTLSKYRGVERGDTEWVATYDFGRHGVQRIPLISKTVSVVYMQHDITPPVPAFTIIKEFDVVNSTHLHMTLPQLLGSSGGLNVNTVYSITLKVPAHILNIPLPKWFRRNHYSGDTVGGNIIAALVLYCGPTNLTGDDYSAVLAMQESL